MIDLTLSAVGASDPRVAGVADDAGAAPETGGAEASFASALAAYAGDDSPEGEPNADGAPEENLDAAAAAAAAVMSANVPPVAVAGPFGPTGSSVDESGDRSSAAVPLTDAEGSAGSAVESSEPASPSINRAAAETEGTHPTSPAAVGESSVSDEGLVVLNRLMAKRSGNTSQEAAPSGTAPAPIAPVISGTSGTATPVSTPPTSVQAATPASDTVTRSTETAATDVPAELSATRAEEAPVARGVRQGASEKIPFENTAAPEAGRSLPAATALTGEAVERAMEAAESIVARTESASTQSTPSPYHLRVAFAASADGGWHDSHSGSSRDGATFAFGGHAHSSQLLPALKLAGASFASALASVPADDGLPAHTAAQIVQSLKLQWARGGGEAEIRLEPHHFGELRIALKVDDGRVTARMEAEAPVVREWLQTNQAALKSGLAEQNLTLDRFEIVDPKRDPRDRESTDERRRENQPKGRRDRRRRDHGGELFEVVA